MSGHHLTHLASEALGEDLVAEADAHHARLPGVQLAVLLCLVVVVVVVVVVDK